MLATVIATSAQTKRTATSLDDVHQAFRAFGGACENPQPAEPDLLEERLRDLVKQALAPHALGGQVVVAGEGVRLGPIAAVTLDMALDHVSAH